MIKWIDEKSVLRNGKKVYKAGDEIPADLLSDSRIDHFSREKKIKIVDYIEVDKTNEKRKKKNSKKVEQVENSKEVKPVESVNSAAVKLEEIALVAPLNVSSHL